MKCRNCGADIPEGMLICPDCFTEVQMVPDYNPLDDEVLVQELEEPSEEGTGTQLQDETARYQEPDRIRNTRPARMPEQQGWTGRTGTDDIRRDTGYVPRSHTAPRRTTGAMRQSTGPVRRSTQEQRRMPETAHRNTGAVRQNTGELRRAAKKRAAKKRRRRLILAMVSVLLVIGAVIFFFYRNSYEGVIRQGYRALEAGEYSAAQRCFERAAAKDKKRADAYEGLSKVYIQQNNTDNAENIFLNAIAVQPDNIDLYEAAIHFYIDTGQQDKVSGLLYGSSETILSSDKISPYVSKMPEFSLKEENYTEVQELSLTSNGTIYYTEDGSEPTAESIPYTGPILLNEGTTIIKAITINREGIPSLVSSMSYTIEIPVADAPAVTPSTGQYHTPTQITVNVPEGYTAYYTMDGTDPSTDAPTASIYYGPIDMPEGHTIFSVVLVNSAGKMTKVTKRNYTLEY